jgi:hypothetical protein
LFFLLFICIVKFIGIKMFVKRKTRHSFVSR